MADNKTEKATPKRREEARKKGQVARSHDLSGAAVLLFGIAALAITGPATFSKLGDVMRQGLSQSGQGPHLATRDGLSSLAMWAFTSVATTVAPVALAAVTGGLLANFAQNRPRLSSAAIKPQWGKLNPKNGFKRLFGTQALFETGKSIVKMSVVALAAFVAVWGRKSELASLSGQPPGAIVHAMATTALQLALYVAGAFMLVAIVDYMWQRYQFEKNLRMSKDEVKQESRQQDVAPEVRSAIRRRQYAQARKRMIADVATADVVVTNPTHFAIALRYDGSTPAPEVVAKGADLVAKTIRSAADEHGVPIISNPPLARALFREVDLGRQIPDEFFQAVAEVLAFVYRTSGMRRRRRRQLAA